jgi:hypothetical protein
MNQQEDSYAPATQGIATPGNSQVVGTGSRLWTHDERPFNLKLVLFWALLGSFLGWLMMLQSYPFFTIYSPAPNSASTSRGPRELDKEDAWKWNMRIGYGIYGTTVGICLGIGFTFGRRSVAAIMASMLISGGLGGLAGFLGGDLANTFFGMNGRTAETHVILQAIIGQGIAWVLCGLSFGIGLAVFSAAWTRRLYAILSGSISGMLAGALHAPIHATFFGENDINLRLPAGSVAQLVWLALPAGLAAILLAGLTDTKGRRST